MEDSAQFVESAWPLVLLNLPPVMNVIAIKGMIDGFERAYSRRDRYAVVVDGSAITKFPKTAERKLLGDWLDDEARAEKERKYCIASAVVMTSGPMRALVSALNWVRPPVTPQVWKATRAEAIEWCCDRIVGAGIPLTGAIEALRGDARRREAGSRQAR